MASEQQREVQQYEELVNPVQQYMPFPGPPARVRHIRTNRMKPNGIK